MLDFDGDTMQVSRIVMERRRVANSTYVSRNAIVSMHDPISHLADEADRLMLGIESHVLADRIATSTERHLVAQHSCSFPTSPWQFFKQRHADSWWLGWLVRRRPVRLDARTKTYHRTVTIGRDVTFPECTRQYPDDFGRPVVVDVIEVGDQEVTESISRLS